MFEKVKYQVYKKYIFICFKSLEIFQLPYAKLIRKELNVHIKKFNFLENTRSLGH